MLHPLTAWIRDVSHLSLADIDGFKGRYQVSDLGRVRKIIEDAGRNPKVVIVEHSIDRSGFHWVSLLKGPRNAKVYLLSYLVYETFKGELPWAMKLRFADGNRDNNRLDNLIAVPARTGILLNENKGRNLSLT